MFLYLVVSSHFSRADIPQEAHSWWELPWLTWMKSVPSGYSRAARTTSQLHFSNASSAHIPRLLPYGYFSRPVELLFILQGLTSLNLGFCVGIKWDNMGGSPLWVVQCDANVRNWCSRLFYPLSSEWTAILETYCSPSGSLYVDFGEDERLGRAGI